MSKAGDPHEPRRRRRRRKEARPGEIVAAAMEVFAEAGFGAAKLEEVARRAGVAKGTVFVYFPTKQDLFRAVAQSVLSTNLERLRGADRILERPVSELIPILLTQLATVAESPVSIVVRLLIVEARAFPDLAQVWYDEVVSKMLGVIAEAIARDQARGIIRAGNPRLYAFSIIGPMVAGAMFRQVFAETDAELPDLAALAVQHARTVLDGLALKGERGP